MSGKAIPDIPDEDEARIQAGIAGPDPCAAARSKKRISAATRATPHACLSPAAAAIHAGERPRARFMPGAEAAAAAAAATW